MMKILIVEDTENSRILLEDVLVAGEYEVDSAVNGLEALRKTREAPADLIISDILMPEMDGFDLCRQLKLDPQLKSIPFIFYTATYTDERDEKFAMSLGATRFVIKPEDPIRLLEIIKEVFTEQQVGLNDTKPYSEDDNNEFEVKHSEVLSKKLDKKIHEIEGQKEQLKFITDAIPALISEIDEFGCYQYSNKAHEKWFGVSGDQIIGKQIKDVAGAALYELVQPYIQKALNGEEAVFEGYVTVANADKRYILARYIPYKNDKMKSYHCFSFINDLTPQKQVEDEKQKLLLQLRQSQKQDAIGHLAGGIAHDFNNILSIILGYSELMTVAEYDNKSGSIEAYNHQIRTAGLRGQDLIRQIMKFSRKSDEQVGFSVDIKPLIKEVIKLVQETFPATVVIDTDLAESISSVAIELSQLHQIMVNLLVNARDAINLHGRILVTLKQEKVKSVVCSSCKQPFEGNYVVLTISDDGTGIGQKHLDQIFELFYTTKEVGKGSGIGLAMVHDIVHESRGHILLESTVGQGTIFKLFFPVSELTEKSLIENNMENLIYENTEVESTIMVVDDEESLVEYLDVLLSSNGYRVSKFTSSLDALEAFQETPDAYDLVVTDQVLPNMTGAEMVEKMFQLRSNLPVILCSGNNSLSDEFIKKLGIKSVLQKPVSAKELLKEIKHLIIH